MGRQPLWTFSCCCDIWFLKSDGACKSQPTLKELVHWINVSKYELFYISFIEIWCGICLQVIGGNSIRTSPSIRHPHTQIQWGNIKGWGTVLPDTGFHLSCGSPLTPFSLKWAFCSEFKGSLREPLFSPLQLLKSKPASWASKWGFYRVHIDFSSQWWCAFKEISWIFVINKRLAKCPYISKPYGKMTFECFKVSSQKPWFLGLKSSYYQKKLI